MPTLEATIPPCGGGVFLSISANSPMTLTRYAQSTNTTVTLYSGNSVPYYIDQGDGFDVNVEYLPDDTYTYTVSDNTGSAVSSSLTPTASILITPDQITSVIIKTIKAGINALVINQSGWIKPRVFHAMPLSGTPSLPFIVVTFDLLQQKYVPIGQQNMPEYNNQINIDVIMERRYTVTTFTTTVDEREFYRDALVAIFESSLFQPLQQLGQNIEHSFQSISTQETDPSPGFFVSDSMWMMTGGYNVKLQTNYGLIESLDTSGVLASPTPP